MSLEEKLESKDAWVKEGSSGIVGKIVRGIAITTFGLAATFGSIWGVAYGLGAEWAENVRAHFDFEYAFYIESIRNLKSDWEKEYFIGNPSFESGILRTYATDYTDEFYLDKTGKLHWYLKKHAEVKPVEKIMDKELQLAIYHHYIEVYGSTRVKLNDVKYQIMIFNVQDKNGDTITDSDTLIQMSNLFTNSVTSYEEKFTFLSTLYTILKENTWQETAKILREEQQ